MSPLSVEKCRCGATYARDEWHALPRVDAADATPRGRDLRACARCGATLGAPPARIDDVAPSGPELPFTD